MRTKTILALVGLLAVALSLPARADDAVFSLHPWAEDEKLVRDPALDGVWNLQDSWLRLRLTFELQEDGEYLVTLGAREQEPAGTDGAADSERPACPSEAPTIRFWGRLYQVRDQLFFEFRPADPPDDLLLLLPVRAILRARLEDERLTLEFASAEWLKQMIEEQRTELAAVEARNALLVTSETAKLYEFLDFYSWDEMAFSSDSVSFDRRR
jgi:hypothetical protein